MDPTQIAETLLTTISPAFPMLKAGTEAFGKKVGELMGEKFQGLWQRIFAVKPVAQAITKAAESPEGKAARAALVAQLEMLMTYHVDLAKELEEWAGQRSGAAPVVAGDGSVVVIGNGNKVAINGSTIVAGDVQGGIHIGRACD